MEYRQKMKCEDLLHTYNAPEVCRLRWFCMFYVKTYIKAKQTSLYHAILTLCFVLQVIQKYMPGGFAGADKDGSPILVELFGYLDFKGMIYSAKKVDIEKSKLKLGEEITEKLEAQSKQVRHVMMHASTQFAFKNVPYHPI